MRSQEVTSLEGQNGLARANGSGAPAMVTVAVDARCTHTHTHRLRLATLHTTHTQERTVAHAAAKGFKSERNPAAAVGRGQSDYASS